LWKTFHNSSKFFSGLRMMLLLAKRGAVPIRRDFMVDSERASWAKTTG
jgi:hypothetical protein